jgi:phosphatidylethanolamine-binding protein (PEBP) family uncharacterized protein
MRRAGVVVMLAALVAGCASGVDTSTLPRMGMDFGFAAKHKCQGVSPEIRLSGVPAGVKKYDVRMVDLDAPAFNHWNETLPATGPIIREGAGKAYVGPCPPSGTHRYQIAVTGRDDKNQPVAYGDKTVVAGR